MPKIISIHAREILDSRGNPTVEAELAVMGGAGATGSRRLYACVSASVPSGASTGIYEALELRDNDKKRYRGKGVLKAIKNVNELISRHLVGKDFAQRRLDEFLIGIDGTKNKTRLGANAILAVSLAFARAAAAVRGVELYEYLGGLVGSKTRRGAAPPRLPVPMMNIINGGKHADSGLDVQEFMIVPVGFSSFHERLRAGSEIFHTLKEILKKGGYGIGVGDEGGFAPRLKSNEEALTLIAQAIKKAGYSTDKVTIGLDVAASSFLLPMRGRGAFEKFYYKIKIGGKEKKLSSGQLLAWYKNLIKKYPIVSIEDGFAEDDWEGFRKMNALLGKKPASRQAGIKIVGDDLLVTNIERINMAIDRKAVNAVLIKLNQIGTLSETIDAILLAKKQGWTPIVSHRSGETEDTFIADLAVGLACPYIKTGSLSRGERICKYNRLLRIEERLR